VEIGDCDQAQGRNCWWRLMMLTGTGWTGAQTARDLIQAGGAAVHRYSGEKTMDRGRIRIAIRKIRHSGKKSRCVASQRQITVGEGGVLQEIRMTCPPIELPYKEEHRINATKSAKGSSPSCPGHGTMSEFADNERPRNSIGDPTREDSSRHIFCRNNGGQAPMHIRLFPQCCRLEHPDVISAH
jgi:hypothetical protein